MTSFRAKLCSNPNLLATRKYKTFQGKVGFTDDPNLLRFGNFVTKTLIIIIVLITAISIFWKKKRLLIRFRRYNVLTFNQTVLLLLLLYICNAVCDYILTSYLSHNAFYLEMFRILLIENIFFKFLLPIFFIMSTKSSLPALWSDTVDRKVDFFMTQSSFKPRSQNTGGTVDNRHRVSFSRQKNRRRRKFHTSLDTITEYQEICEKHSSKFHQSKSSLSYHIESRRKGRQNTLSEIEIC